MPRIIVVEDDPAIGEMLEYHLKDLNYEIQLFDNGLDAKHYLTNHDDFDLVILDIMLPGYNGLDLCRELRQQKPDIMILLLTSLDGEADRVIGLELGADDYLTKPFSIRECQARVKALLRRVQRASSAPKTSANQLSFDGLEINIEQHEVILGGDSIELTAREFDLLKHLAENAGNVFSRHQLLDTVWGYSHDGYEHTVNTHINRLRKKLKRPDLPDYVQTVWGVGYKFVKPNK
ncbi:DNA-binding response regulator [Gammaproteobacteria bacterium 45_16_T64]|nr:DNA-binding response regulator [Gammaproteobacteria bacterium 45_16_T64]